MSLAEELDYLPSDDPEVIYESDIDWLAELRTEDEAAEAETEAIRDFWACCGGRNWYCMHYGMSVPSLPERQDF